MWGCCDCSHEEDDKPQPAVYNYAPGMENRSEELSSLLASTKTPRYGDVTAMSTSEKLHEKARLQELVKGFAKRAVHGVACHLVDVATGRVVPATFEVDRQLKRLRVVPKDPDMPVFSNSISRVREAFSIEAGEAAVPPAVRAALVEEQRRRLVLISFEDMPMVCILEASAAERDRLVTCMKILRLYAQTG
uniref:Uncharacterized protein n=1 Tax=Alexandrium andersonii TaxID=327968 RepID=A0A7S2CNE5_9DINO|mmetsp:Transcript_4114/g.9229  ORF Transcript_4114/g.9229 Transcript_4114/m.9229 type:complete len:191 (+) Transcript_4114:93-665(+)